MNQSFHSNNLTLATLFLSLALSTISAAEAQEADQKKIYDTLTIYWENDAFAGTDRDYTNGSKITWSTPFLIDKTESHLPEWSYYFINKVPFVNDPESSRAVSVSIGQNIYTPEDVWQTSLVVDDRPYAGYLYSATGFHSRTSNRKNSWEFQLGIVGPLSFAEETQTWSHDLLGSKRTEGWDNQLSNEISLEAIYESQWMLLNSDHSRGYSYDLIPHMGFRMGNVATYLNAGAEVRFGLNLPGNFGSCPIRAGCATNSAFNSTFNDAPLSNRDTWFTGWYLFFAVDGRAVLHDIFLDGNTFKDSHSVKREVWVADLMTGIAFDFGNVRTTYSYIFRTKQFKEDDNNQIFGSLNISLAY
ncbi:MAG: lipid A deacylase LpxR family protein [Desulfobulbaceae bacterium]|nr:lipid A deacylase LpxR family protein [Desulfobulbaceae bacterium]